MRSRTQPIHVDTTNEIYKARIINLTNLLNLDFETLIATSVKETDYHLDSDGSKVSGNFSTSGSSCGENVKMNWRETHRLKGEIMLKVVFHIAQQCASSLSSDAWGVLTQLLVSLVLNVIFLIRDINILLAFCA